MDQTGENAAGSEVVDYLKRKSYYYKETADRWAAKNKHRLRGIKLKHRYNITEEQYDSLLEKQNGVCVICKQLNSNGKRLYIDHDHNCCKGTRSCGKCIRGLLCNNCNAAIGLLQESLELIGRAAQYLRKTLL